MGVLSLFTPMFFWSCKLEEYLSWAQCDQTDVLTEGALLNLVDKLGQLRVSATAIVDLQTQLASELYPVGVLNYRKVGFFTHMYTLVTCSSTSSSSSSSSRPSNLHMQTHQIFEFYNGISDILVTDWVYLLLLFESSSLSYSATICSSSSWSSGASAWSSLLSWSNLNASSSSWLYKSI